MTDDDPDNHELSIKPGPGRKDPDDEPESLAYVIVDEHPPTRGCHGCKTLAAVGATKRSGMSIMGMALGVGAPCAQCVRAPAYGRVRGIMEAFGVQGKDNYQPEDEPERPLELEDEDHGQGF